MDYCVEYNGIRVKKQDGEERIIIYTKAKGFI